MRWIDFPAIAEFEDRRGIVRSIRGCTILGRFEFGDRMADISEIVDRYPPDLSWERVYRENARFRHAIERALACWGIDIEWLALSQIEQLLFGRGDERGWLIEIANDLAGSGTADRAQATSDLAESIAAISTHCQSLMEAMEMANAVPAKLLTDILEAKARAQIPAAETNRRERMDYLRANFTELMAKPRGDTP